MVLHNPRTRTDAARKIQRLGSRIALGAAGQINGIAQPHEKKAPKTKRVMQMMSIQTFAMLLRIAELDGKASLFAVSKEGSSSSNGWFSNIHYPKQKVSIILQKKHQFKHSKLCRATEFYLTLPKERYRIPKLINGSNLRTWRWLLTSVALKCLRCLGL